MRDSKPWGGDPRGGIARYGKVIASASHACNCQLCQCEAWNQREQRKRARALFPCRHCPNGQFLRLAHLMIMRSVVMTALAPRHHATDICSAEPLPTMADGLKSEFVQLESGPFAPRWTVVRLPPLTLQF